MVRHLCGDAIEKQTAAGMLIPAAAAGVDSDRNAYVSRNEANTSMVSRATLTLGDMSADSVRVLSGLKSGDRIAVSGAAHLQEGMKVKPLAE